jgi:hypothetical protein
MGSVSGVGAIFTALYAALFLFPIFDVQSDVEV